MEQARLTVPDYVREIDDLEQTVLKMASLAESMVARSVEALHRLDTGLARQVMEEDDELDSMELAAEQMCLKLLSLQEPLSTNLREIATVIKIITDIERIGDLAVDVSKATLKVDQELGHTSYVDVPLMANVARQMLRLSTAMFVKRDAGLITEVQVLEDRVDELYRVIRGQIFDYMIRNHDEAVSAGWLLLTIHHIERVADHALNIAERCYFMVTGEAAGKPQHLQS